MICVSIGRGRHRHVIAEHRHLVEQGAQLVELRLDYIQGTVNLKRLIDNRPGPVLIACRRSCDGGKWPGKEEDRQMLLRSAIASGVEYVDLEEDIASKIPRYGKTKRVISYHDFRKTPDELDEVHARLRKLDPDVIKIACVANRPHDNTRMLMLTKNADFPTVGLCMGDMGTSSRILSGKFGSPFTYATFHQERVLAPGQLSYEQMTRIYRYDAIGPKTEVYGVIGDPIGHSLSPHVHNAAFRQAGLDKIYVPFRVPREDLATFMLDARRLGIRGLSVTIPHKNQVYKLLTKIDDSARAVRACNTVLFNGDELHGYNTDYQAAMESLEQAMGGLRRNPSPVAGKTALVLGAGGAAQAIAHGLMQRKAEVVLSCRTLQNAELLADSLDCGAVEWETRHEVEADILINCTPVGMHPHVNETPYDKGAIRRSMVVFDTVYNPENTLLVKEAHEHNCTVVTGVDMFVRQAALQYKLFTDLFPPADLMRDVVKRTTGAAKY